MTNLTRIIGFGNPLGGDDGFGPAVLAALARETLPPAVELCLGPPTAWDALDLFAGCKRVIVVDVIAAGRPAGALNWFEPSEIIDDGLRGQHALGLGGLLRILPARCSPLPAILILGAEPQELASATPALSPALASAVTPAVTLIQQTLQC